MGGDYSLSHTKKKLQKIQCVCVEVGGGGGGEREGEKSKSERERKDEYSANIYIHICIGLPWVFGNGCANSREWHASMCAGLTLD